MTLWKLIPLRCKKLATIVSGRKNVTWLFVRWKKTSTSVVKKYLQVYTSTVGRVTFFWPETSVVSFLHLTVLIFKVLINYSNYEDICVTIATMCFISSLRHWKAQTVPNVYVKNKRSTSQGKCLLFDLQHEFKSSIYTTEWCFKSGNKQKKWRFKCHLKCHFRCSW